MINNVLSNQIILIRQMAAWSQHITVFDMGS